MLNHIPGFEINYSIVDCLETTLHYIVMKGRQQCVIFIHGHVPT